MNKEQIIEILEKHEHPDYGVIRPTSLYENIAEEILNSLTVEEQPDFSLIQHTKIGSAYARLGKDQYVMTSISNLAMWKIEEIMEKFHLSPYTEVRISFILEQLQQEEE